MTSVERVNALVDAVDYIVHSNVNGALVECGVWRGGSVMAMAMALEESEDTRDIYLYDTFCGMTAPTDVDKSIHGVEAQARFEELRAPGDASGWCHAPLEDAKRNVLSTGYPRERLHFVEGKVEDTIPRVLPTEIALLRLDTDWYESTKHELIHLFPLLSPGGVLIIDDYGYWEGVTKAVDEFVEQTDSHLLLHRVDYGCRIAVKASSLPHQP